MEKGRDRRAARLRGQVEYGPIPTDGALTWPWLTTERALFGAALLMAAFLRFVALGSRPLDNDEAAIAVQSWQAIRGGSVDLLSQPLLTYGGAIVFLLVGASDTAARLLPALAGTAMVVLPYFLRGYLGRLGALAAAYLLAISPSLVFFSGTADSAIIAIALMLALVTLLVHPEWRLRPYLAGLTIGLMLMSGPLGLASLALVGVGVAYIVLMGRRVEENGLAGAMADLPDRQFWARAGSAAAIAYGLVATGFGANLHGLQAGLPDALETWLAGAGFSSQPGLLLLSYEPLALVLAVLALAWGVARRPTDNILAGWAILSLALATLTAGSHPDMVLLALLPLLLLAGQLVGYLFTLLGDGEFRRPFGLLCLGLGPWIFLLYLWSGHFSRPGADAMKALGATPPAVLLIPIGIAILSVIGYAIYRLGPFSAGQSLALFAALLLAAFSIHTSFAIIQPDLEAPAQLLLARPTSTDVRTLARELQDTVDALAFLPGSRQVQVEERFRLPLAWYLRDVRDLSFVPRVSDGVAIAVLGVDSPAPSSKYKGRRYQLAFDMQGRPLYSGADRLWRWFMYREPTAPPLSEGVVMLVRGR